MNNCKHGDECEVCPAPNEKAVAAEFVSRINSVSEMRFALGLIAEVGDLYRYDDRGLEFGVSGLVFFITSQAPSIIRDGSCRSDFVISKEGKDGRFRPIVIVEIDDASHWRDAVKSSADRRRDRDLLNSMVAPTMRFSNDDIATGPRGCAKEVIDFVVRFEGIRENYGQAMFLRGAEYGDRPVASAVTAEAETIQ